MALIWYSTSNLGSWNSHWPFISFWLGQSASGLKYGKTMEAQFIDKEKSYKLFAVGVDANLIVNYGIWHWPLTGIEWSRLLSAPWPSATKNANTGKNYSRFSVRAANLNPYILRLENLNMLESWELRKETDSLSTNGCKWTHVNVSAASHSFFSLYVYYETKGTYNINNITIISMISLKKSLIFSAYPLVN